MARHRVGLGVEAGDPQLCPLLPAGSAQRTLPGAPCATAVTPAAPLVTPSPESHQVLGLGCSDPT